MDFYDYLVSGGFNVHPTSHLFVCNAKKGENSFDSVMRFDESLLPTNAILTDFRGNSIKWLTS